MRKVPNRSLLPTGPVNVILPVPLLSVSDLVSPLPESSFCPKVIAPLVVVNVEFVREPIVTLSPNTMPAELLVLIPSPLMRVVPPESVVSDTSLVSPPTTPPKVVVPAVLTASVTAPLTVSPRVMSPPLVETSVVLAPSVTASP